LNPLKTLAPAPTKLYDKAMFLLLYLKM